MEDKVEDYVEFLMKQLVLYQSRIDGNIKKLEQFVISRIVKETVYREIDSDKEYHLPLSYIIGNEIVNMKIDNKSIVDQIKTTANKKVLKTLKNRLLIPKRFEQSEFLKSIKKSGDINNIELLKNIPAIDCYISNNSLRALGYTEDGYEIIYEINKNDEKATSRDIKLISMKEIMEKETTQTTK